MASLFIGFLVEKYVACQSRMASFSFSPCLMRKRVEMPEAILAPVGGGGGECTPIHYLYGYLPPKGVVILKLLI